jgi:voltage-gated potassium channel
MERHTNTRRLAHVAAFLTTLYATAVVAYMKFERHRLSDAAWWAFMTFTTVGYGDQYPHTTIGRIAAIALVIAAVFVAVPSITAVVVSTVLVDHDEWTHDEQEEVKYLLRELGKRKGIPPYEPEVSKFDIMSLYQ